MIFLYTDFGLEGPYVGQMRAAIARECADSPVLDLCHDLAPFDPRSAAYLLGALTPYLPAQAIVVGVVDPGVGTARDALVLKADKRVYVGPDNGLFAIAARHARRAAWYRLDWHPEQLSSSFHGRDLFAPAAARIAAGRSLETTPLDGAPQGAQWPPALWSVIYIDHYGNAMTGIPADRFDRRSALVVNGRSLDFAATFGAVSVGTAFWYENSLGLVEVAANQAPAARILDLKVGTPVGLAQ